MGTTIGVSLRPGLDHLILKPNLKLYLGVAVKVEI